MADKTTTHNPMGSFGLPLLISLGGVIMSTLALAIYHFILLKCCLRPRQMQQRHSNNQNHDTKNSSCGVQEEILNKIPVIKYSVSTSDVFGLDQGECSICLGELKDGDLVRVLPTCNHAFHIPCIDAWFKEHASCPFCRSQITCDIESVLIPIVPENGGQQRVLHETPNDNHDHHHGYQLMDGIEVSGSTPTSRFFHQPPQPMLFRHSISTASSHIHEKPPVLKRSWSLDESYLYIATITTNKRRNQEIMAPTSSSTTWDACDDESV
ncbi:hypothetical protein RIF29_39860 [Crotalaria pallida]|uniref:RING-type E3 ubiquitin transferase n=1 Tax=Crotalaria pallida TaxID=3830 RepID=A0AAN9E2K8_CROPI